MQFGRLLALRSKLGLWSTFRFPTAPLVRGGLSELGGDCWAGRAAQYRQDGEATVSSWACSVEKAQSQLDFEPPLAVDRLRETAQWYRREGWV
jgi:hypothetical protein